MPLISRYIALILIAHLGLLSLNIHGHSVDSFSPNIKHEVSHTYEQKISFEHQQACQKTNQDKKCSDCLMPCCHYLSILEANAISLSSEVFLYNEKTFYRLEDLKRFIEPAFRPPPIA